MDNNLYDFNCQKLNLLSLMQGVTGPLNDVASPSKLDSFRNLDVSGGNSSYDRLTDPSRRSPDPYGHNDDAEGAVGFSSRMPQVSPQRKRDRFNTSQRLDLEDSDSDDGNSASAPSNIWERLRSLGNIATQQFNPPQHFNPPRQFHAPSLPLLNHVIPPPFSANLFLPPIPQATPTTYQNLLGATGPPFGDTTGTTPKVNKRPQRGQKKPIPNSLKDQKYFDRRKRNNMAAKKSRDNKKNKDDEIAKRAIDLENENTQKAMQLATLKVLCMHVHMTVNGGGSPGRNSSTLLQNSLLPPQ